MRYLFSLALLLFWGSGWSQGSGFSFNYSGPTQILVGPDCEEPLNWGHPNTPTAMSNIPGGVIVSFQIYSISPDYEINDQVPGGTTVTVFYQAFDNFGNSALFGFSISFIDVLPPVFDPLSLPPNITISCTTNVPPPADVEASDNCENENTNLTITFTETNNAQFCTGGSIQRKWVADDDLGNFSTFIQTITVTPDVTPPVIANNLQNGMAPCSTAMAQYTTWLNAQRAAFTATDNGCGLMTLSDNAPSPALITSFCGVIDVTFSAKDNCNNISTVIKTFTVFNNVPPVITTSATGAEGNCSQSNIAQIFNTWINNHGGATATDDCSSIFWTTFPPSPSLNDTCNAAIEVLFIAGDGCNNFDTTSASFILTDDTPPNFTTDPSTKILSCTSTTIDSTLLDWLVTGGGSSAHDLCTDDEDLILGYKLGGMALTLEEVLEAWEDSLVSGCYDNVMIGGLGINNVKAYLPLEFTYTDNCANEKGKIGYFGITDNGRPTFDTMPQDTSFACSQNESWEDAFMSWYNTAGAATYSDLCSDVIVNASITADSAIQYLTAALDTACLQGVEVTIQFSLTDECGNNSLLMPSASFGIQDTTPPVILTPAMDATFPCAEDVQMPLEGWLDTLGGMQASDGCGTLTWAFSWIDSSGMMQSGVPDTGPYPQLSNLDCANGLEVVFTGMDICQNSVSDTALFVVIDTLPPMIIIAEDSVHLTCNDTIPSTPPIVTDGCDNDPLISFTDSVSVDSCLGLPEFIIRTWTATDQCGNAAEAQQWFFRVDTIAPTFDLPPDTSAICSIDTLSLLNVTDHCDPSPVVTWNDELSGPACGQTLTRIWTVTDACGNVATATQQFDLSDDAPPEIVLSPGDYVHTCDTSSLDLQTSYEQWQDSVTIEDGCSSSFYFIALRGSYTLEDTATWPGTPVPDSIMLMCGIDLTILADLVAYDECDNVIVEEISFTVNDTIGPSFIDCPDILMVEPDTTTCDALVNLIAPAFEEICFPEDVIIALIIDQGDTIVLDSTLTIDTTLTVGIHTAEWIASDCNGNIGTCTTSIQIIAETALSVICPADTLIFTTVDTCQASLVVSPPITISGSCSLGVIARSFYIDGIAEPSSFTFDSATHEVMVALSAGLHHVYLIAQDSTGDIDSCMYIVEVRDTFPPDLVCQNDTIVLHPSGLDDIDVASTNLVVIADDACGIDHIMYDPPIVNCTNNGQSVPITITVLDQNGNTSTCQSILVVNTQTLMPASESQLCDDTLRLFANMPDGPDSIYTFSWAGPNSFTSAEENPIIPGADTSYSGQYILTVESENGCISMGSVEVLVEALNSLPTIVIPDTLCTGENVLMTTKTFSGEVTYQWFHDLPSIDTLLGNTSSPQFTYIPTEPGIFSVYVIASQDTCTSGPGIPVEFVVVSIPEASILDVPTILCNTDTLYLSPMVIYDSLQYAWTGSDGFNSSFPDPPGIPASEIDMATIYTLTVSNAYCSSMPDSIEVFVQLPPDTPVISGDTLACEEGDLLLIASPTLLSYEWIDPNGNSIFTNNDSLNISTIGIDQSGGWQVIAYENGCPSDTSALYFVSVDSSIQIAIVPVPVVCEGDSIVLSIDPILPGTYAWWGPDGFISNDPTPNALAVPGTYYATLITANGCEANDSTEVSVDILPVITSLMTDADSCVTGIDPITIWAETQPLFSGTFSYFWDGPSGFMVLDSSIVIDSATSFVNGVYSLIITSGACITDTSSIIIDVKDSPRAPTIVSPNIYCFGDSIMLLIENPVMGGMYSWTSSDTNVVITAPGILIIPNATPAWNGIYTVSLIVDGCTSELSSIGIQVRPALFPPSILSPPLVCEGDSLVLTSNAPDGAMLHWISSNGFDSMEDEPVIYPVTPADAGTYQLVYTLNGCPSPPSNPYKISVQPTLAAPAIMTNLIAVCLDDPIPITLCIDPASLIDGGIYTWYLNESTVIGSPGSDSCITIIGAPLQGGLNSITATVSLQGCPSAQGNSIVITGDQVPDQEADAGIDIIACPGDMIILDASDPQPGTGVWTSDDDMVIFSDPADPMADIVGLPSGMYSIGWTLSYASCFNYSQDSMIITVMESPITNPDTVEVPFGQTIEFDVTTNDIINIDPFTVAIVQPPQRGNVLHVGNGIFRYAPNVGFVGTDMMIYRICSTVCPEECSESIVILKVGNEDDCFVPSLFTPNNDGVNDILIVPCLETDRYPNNKITVFNEWGDAVFVASPYENDWDGTNNGSPLPVGTYFYIMDFGDGSTPKRTFLILER